MRYVDGFLLPVPKKNVSAYLRMSRKFGRIIREYGALEYRECVGDDLKTKMGIPFPRAARARRGEAVVFSWIVYRSRAHRDRVLAKMKADPRLDMNGQPMPFDPKRMAYGGFAIGVDL